MLKIPYLLTNTVFLIVNATCFYVSVMIKILNRNMSNMKKKKAGLCLVFLF